MQWGSSGEVPAHAAPHAEQTPEEAVMEAPQQLEAQGFLGWEWDYY